VTRLRRVVDGFTNLSVSNHKIFKAALLFLLHQQKQQHYYFLLHQQKRHVQPSRSQLSSLQQVALYSSSVNQLIKFRSLIKSSFDFFFPPNFIITAIFMIILKTFFSLQTMSSVDQSPPSGAIIMGLFLFFSLFSLKYYR
jgi:hypothetical protein